MRVLGSVFLVGAIFGLAFGCNKEFSGAKVNKFTGKIMSGGKQITVPADTEVQITLRLLGGGQGGPYGIPIKPDGTFEITWMPVGSYAVALEKRNLKAAKGAPDKRILPDEFQIEAGKTEYTIDLGKAWK